MDVSVKIPEEDLLLLSKMKNMLRERNIKATKKNLISSALRLGMMRPQELMHTLMDSKKMNRKEATKKFFADTERFDFGDNWLEEIDTTL